MLDKQLIRGIVILLLGGCASPNTASQFNNSQLLEKGVRFSKCIDEQPHSYDWTHYNSSNRGITNPNKIGAIVHPNSDNIAKVDDKTISIRILPYIITKSGSIFYLLPEVPEKMKRITRYRSKEGRECVQQQGKKDLCTQIFKNYYPACQANSVDLAYDHPEFYPIVLLSVDSPDDLNKLEGDLRDALSSDKKIELIGEFASFPGNLRSMDAIIKEILKKQPSIFFQNFGATMKLPDKNTAETSSCTELQNELDKTRRERNELKQEVEQLRAENRELKTGQSSDHNKFIVVSLSNSRELKSKARAIQDSFIKVLSELKRKSWETRFTLLTIGSGRKVEKLLTSAELPNLFERGSTDTSIDGKINTGLQFGASDLRALADLNLVDETIQNSAIKSVLYITDNIRISNDPPSIERGVPLAWYEDGIRLTVLTTKGCDVWKKVKAQCSSWNDKSAFSKELKKFMGLRH